MSYTLVVNPEAEADLAEAEAWYRQIRLDLADHFLEEVQASLERVRRRPLMHAVEYKGARKSRVRGFPYFAVYRVEAETVVVLGFFHDARDPSLWRSRL